MGIVKIVIVLIIIFMILMFLILSKFSTADYPKHSIDEKFVGVMTKELKFNDDIKLSVFNNVNIKSLKGTRKIYMSPVSVDYYVFEFDVEFNNNKERKEWIYNNSKNLEIENCLLIIDNGEIIDLCKDYPISIELSAKKPTLKLFATLTNI